MQDLAYLLILAAIVGPPLLAFFIIRAAVREGVRQALALGPSVTGSGFPHPAYEPPTQPARAETYARLPGGPIPGRSR